MESKPPIGQIKGTLRPVPTGLCESIDDSAVLPVFAIGHVGEPGPTTNHTYSDASGPGDACDVTYALSINPYSYLSSECPQPGVFEAILYTTNAVIAATGNRKQHTTPLVLVRLDSVL